MKTLTVHTIADGYLAAAAEGSHSHRYFMCAEEDPDTCDVRMVTVPDSLAAQLEAQGTSDQWFDDGYVANSALAAALDDRETFVRAYLETILWAETYDHCGECAEFESTPLDREFTVEDFAPEAIMRATADCERFREENADTLKNLDVSQTDAFWGMVAHDFWLTRNRHGAGFWDGDYPEPHASTLTDSARSFGELTAYVGDDRKIYLS